MSSDAYRSYVVRVRRPRAARAHEDQSLRIDVEDLLDGGRAVIDGDSARILAEGLEAMFEVTRPPAPKPDSPGE